MFFTAVINSYWYVSDYIEFLLLNCSRGLVIPRSNSISYDGRHIEPPLPLVANNDEGCPSSPIDSIDLGSPPAVNGTRSLQTNRSLPSSPRELFKDNEEKPMSPNNGKGMLHERECLQMTPSNWRGFIHGRVSVSGMPNVQTPAPQFISKDTSHARQQVSTPGDFFPYLNFIFVYTQLCKIFITMKKKILCNLTFSVGGFGPWK